MFNFLTDWILLLDLLIGIDTRLVWVPSFTTRASPPLIDRQTHASSIHAARREIRQPDGFVASHRRENLGGRGKR